MELGVNSATASAAAEPSLSERAYRTLRDMIVTLEIPPGSPIHEERLGKSIGVGRTPVREAIKRLASEDLVAIYPRRGTFTSEINTTDHGLIAEVRRHLEGQAARSAAARASSSQRAELAELAARTDERPDDVSMMRLDTEIHRAIYRCTHNRYLEATLNHYYNLTLRIWYLFLPRLGNMSEHLAEHEHLLRAITEGDGDRAARIATSHVDHFENAVFEALRT